MKKLIVFGFAALLISGLSACKKFTVNNAADVANTEENVNVSLNANQVYRYALPTPANAGNVAIVSAAAKSSIAIVDSTGGSTFVYTPSQSFSGSDVVTITHPQHANNGGNCDHHGKGKHHDGHGNCNHHSGHCNKGGNDHDGNGVHKITFHINVNALAK